MNKIYEFVLAKGGVPLGYIRWNYDSDEADNCHLAGDAAALTALQTSMKKAVAEKWLSRYPQPSFGIVSNPLCSLKQMITVLQIDGYDMPDVLSRYTPEAQNTRSAKIQTLGCRY